MNGNPSKTSFFSFGQNDSFISQSFQGLKHQNLSAPLQDLLRVSQASEVHWATLGPVTDSWVLSFKDSTGTNTVRWGNKTPQRLQDILTKTWHSPHLRCFLGPANSYIIWTPELIRWAHLPDDLEETLQSWLTPSGWRVGPPRIATWGSGGAFFAMSEYGTAAYRLGDGRSWQIYKETVEDWKAEKGFLWSKLAFIALDPSNAGSFIAIRKDGTWAGSIDGPHEDALESFALNFFAQAKSHHKSKPSTSSNHTNDRKPADAPKTVHIKPSIATQKLYTVWATDTASKFAAASTVLGGSKPGVPRKLEVRSPSSSSSTSTRLDPPRAAAPSGLFTTFPYLPSSITDCKLTTCTMFKSAPHSIQACQHDVEKLFRASGLYSQEWLRQERLRWHPDRFGRLCEESWRDVGKNMAGEMFKLIGTLLEDLTAEESSKK